MRGKVFVWAAIVAAMLPAAALADDPHDPAMRNAAARARDREITRGLNAREHAMVRQRDARYARERRGFGGDEYAARSQDHDRAMASYARNRAQYEREMAEWRNSVAACRSGDYSACD
jgi:hypothetical protein